MNLFGLTLVKVDDSTVIKPFDCGDPDLNDFLLHKAKNYKNEMLAVTYLLENEERTIGFFSIFNDSVSIQKENFSSKSAYRKFLKNLVSHRKRHLEDFPAIKIGRLAVCNQTQHGGVGRLVIDFIIHLARWLNGECACKLITVDAYSDALGFYEKQGFQYFTDADKEKDTRQMFLDLSMHTNAI